MLPDNRKFRFEIYDRIIKNKKILHFALEELTIKSKKRNQKSRRYFVNKKNIKNL